MKIAGIGTASAILILATAAVCLRLYYSDFRIKTILEEKLSAALRSDVTLRSFRLESWLTVRMDGFKAGDPAIDGDWIEVDRMVISISPGALLGRRLYVKDIDIEGGKFDYSKLPAFDSTAAPAEKAAAALPIAVSVDRFSLSGLTISGPEMECLPRVEIKDVELRDLNDFSFSYDIRCDSGALHYAVDSMRLDATLGFAMRGAVSDSIEMAHRMDFALSDIRISFPQEYEIGRLAVTLRAASEPAAAALRVDTLDIALNDRKIIGCSGHVDLSSGLKLSLDASGTEWRVSDFADIANRLRIPLKPEGSMRLSKGRLTYKGTEAFYDFTLDIDDMGLRFGDGIVIGGINGQVFSDGDLSQIVFGSSLTVDSIVAASPDGSAIRFKGLSSAVESEVSGSDYTLNITSGIVDFLGGRLDLSAFSENSAVTGKLTVSDINLAKVSSEAAGSADTTVFGLLDLTVDIQGVLDSISSVLRADARNVTVVSAGDTLRLGDQGLQIDLTTLADERGLKTTANYRIGPLIEGLGELLYPIGSSGDSLVISYNMDIDNSLIPSYFPISMARAVGAVDISGTSRLSGRLASPPDSMIIEGRSNLSVNPTDLLIEDFSSLLFQLVSASEIDVSRDSVAIHFDGNVGELYAEEYSDLPFPDVRFDGEMRSLDDTTWALSSFAVDIPSRNLRLTAGGRFGSSGGVDFADLDIDTEFRASEAVPLSSAVSAAGRISARTKLRQWGELLEFSGSILMDSITLSGENDLYCSGLRGEIPFYGAIDLNDSVFVDSRDERTPRRSSFNKIKHADPASTGYGFVSVDLAAMGNIAATNLEIDLLFRDGHLEIPSYSGEFLGGTFGGGLSLDFTAVNILREYPDYEKISYNASLEATGLDFNQLVYGYGPYSDKAGLSTAAHFRGHGIISPGADYDIDGRLHITRMGPEVVDRILDFVDPENQNPGVIQTRSLLHKKLLGIIDVSYKPTEFIVEIKHGSLYPGLYMTQPFVTNVIPLMRIPMPIRYGRIPLDMIFSGMEEK